VVTADALHCQRTHADYLHARGPHHVFTVKGNQPTLRRALVRLPWPQGPAYATGTPDTAEPSPARSRSSTRTARRRPGCPARRPPIKVVRRRGRAGQARPSVETVYVITSLGHRDADLQVLAD